MKAFSQNGERYLDVVSEHGRCASRERYARYLLYLFDHVSFKNKHVLDIGAGVGLMGLLAASEGASRVVCLEPEAAGGKSGMRDTFHELSAALPIDADVTMQADTFQSFDSKDARFDVVIMHNSINHLDEQACEHLLGESDAVEKYLDLLRKLHAMCRTGAQLIITDCSRYNLFGLFNRRSPFAPAITWKLHQSPKHWARLLGLAGFANPRIRWTVFNRLTPIQRVFLGNGLVAWLTSSRFCLTVSRP